MSEELEESPKKSINWGYYIQLIRRRSWYFLLPLFIGWAVVWGISWMLPSVYRSGTLILVEQPTVPQQYVVPNIASNLQDRLDTISQQILSRSRLLQIIQRFDLYPNYRNQGPDAMVEHMRKDIEIELVRAPDREVSSFNVYFSHVNPLIAQQVTTALTNLFINENLETRQKQSESTTNFLEAQLEDARQALSEQEEKVRLFKEKNLGELPGQTQSNLQILTGLQAQLQSEEDNLSRGKQQNTYLESLLSQYRTLQRSSKSGTVVSGGLPAIDQQLDKLRSQLADLSSHYTDRHPDVRKLREEIAKTQRMREQLTAELNSSSDQAQKGVTGVSAMDSADTNTPAIMQLDSQLRANQIEIANRQRAIEATEKEIRDYQARLNQAPVREQEYVNITRGYEQSKANYDSLLKKKNDSELATSLELRQQGEHFRILDPPSLPQRPFSPNRIKLCGMALGVGLVLGAGLAFGTEFLDDRVYNEDELKKLLPVGIISELPNIATPEEESKRSWNVKLLIAATAGMFLCIALGSAFSFLKG